MDNKKLLELKQERATVITSIRAIMDEHEKIEMPAEKRGEMEKAEKRFDEINKVLLEKKNRKKEKDLLVKLKLNRKTIFLQVRKK